MFIMVDIMRMRKFKMRISFAWVKIQQNYKKCSLDSF